MDEMVRTDIDVDPVPPPTADTNTLTHANLPLHSFFEEKPNYKATALNTLCTPVCTPTIGRWTQLANLFNYYKCDYDSVKKEILDHFLLQANTVFSEEDISGFGLGRVLNNFNVQQLQDTLSPVLRQDFDATVPTGLVQAAPAEQAASVSHVVKENPAMADGHSIVTMLNCYYEPAVLRDLPTIFNMMLHLCSNHETRIELLNLLLLVLENSPTGFPALESLFNEYLQTKTESSATPSNTTLTVSSLPPRPATAFGTTNPIGENTRNPTSMPLKQYVITQRTLQLLIHLVGNHEAVESFFITENPLIRQASLQQLSSGKLKASSKRMIPLGLLLTCFESPGICGQSMLGEHMLHLIALVTARFIIGRSTVALPLNQLGSFVRTLQVCELTHKAAEYVQEIFSNLAALPNIYSTLVADLKELV